MSATNHKGIIKGRGDLDPAAFSVENTQRNVLAALASAASVRQGPKQFTMPMHPEALRGDPMGVKLKRGQTVVREFAEREGNEDGFGLRGFSSETISNRRDKAGVALCAKCGTPHGLKACSGCKKIWYCGPVCQK